MKGPLDAVSFDTDLLTPAFVNQPIRVHHLLLFCRLLVPGTVYNSIVVRPSWKKLVRRNSRSMALDSIPRLPRSSQSVPQKGGDE